MTLKQLVKPKYRTWLIPLWIILSLGFLVAKYAVPIVFAPYIIIDNAAPVAPQAIYYPTYKNLPANAAETNPQTLLEIYALEVPSAFRAIGSVDSVNSTLSDNPPVSIDQPEILAPDPASGDPNQRINYHYTVTGLDFGLQHYPDLILNVEGSCHTDYSWCNGSSPSNSDPTLIEDFYVLPFDNQTYKTVSLDDGPSPAVQFFMGPNAGTGPLGNWTWAALISSVNRTSYWNSSDPWYLTVPDIDPQSPPYRVKPGRPALSCWQNDVWSYHGHESSVAYLNSSDLPGLELSGALQDIFAHFLGQPKIQVLGTRLGASALKSASTSYYDIFNASSSSLYTDLARLVFASYIGTANTLTETTLFARSSNVENDVLTLTIDAGTIPPGIDEFVIWSTDVITLSVKALIIIPVVTATLWIIAIVVFFLPLPEIAALSATVSTANQSGKASGKGEETHKGKPEEESRTEKLVEDTIDQVADFVSNR
ncbi:hypothetical protein ABVK25_011272 [Lepraria finkii]|uniref:Uncharacterized protein n=1 Tax=Lepraria finkii TaxID=1340010 RepID=A0ABR4AQ64_9LECA